jgi:hypothetical protein
MLEPGIMIRPNSSPVVVDENVVGGISSQKAALEAGKLRRKMGTIKLKTFILVISLRLILELIAMFNYLKFISENIH